MTYSHRDNATEPPYLDGEYWFDGCLLCDTHYYETGHRFRQRLVVCDNCVELWFYEDTELIPVWNFAGRWSGPIVPPWEEEICPTASQARTPRPQPTPR